LANVADDIINGDVCQFCGQFFILPGEGAPRTCVECIKMGLDDTDEKVEIKIRG